MKGDQDTEETGLKGRLTSGKHQSEAGPELFYLMPSRSFAKMIIS